MAGNLTAMIAAAFSGGAAPPVTSDPYFDYTTLLLPGNGTNGAQNNTFLDSSTNNFTITRNGNTTQGTFSPFSQTGWGNYFNGSNAYLTFANDAAFQLGTGDFTIEFWWNGVTSGTFAQNIGTLNTGVEDGTYRIGTTDNSGNSVYFRRGNGSGFDAVVYSVNVNDGAWHHIAVVRTSGVIAFYVDGTARTPSSGSANISGTCTSSNPLRIGYNPRDVAYINGYMSNARIVKGTAVYTSNFTPSTTPLTAISGTSLLTCQSNRFVDNSTNNFTLTVNGSPSVQAFSPFNPSASWSAATYGGSGYFDGSGDYLSYTQPGGVGNGDFTLELWLYPIQIGDAIRNVWDCRSVEGGTDGFWLGSDTTNFYMYYASSKVISTSYPIVNAWTHVALVRSGNDHKLYFNGTQVGSTYTAANNYSNTSIFISRYFGSATYYTNGYFSSLRLVKGTAVYTGNFTPPTAPLTAITNTSLLLNYTNAGIYDATSKNDLETVGNAQISTAQSKWGGSSMAFDETGDYLTLPASQNVALGSGDFTIECWARFAASTVSNGMGLFQLSSGYLNSQVRGPAAGADNTTGRWSIYYGTSSTVHASLAPSTNTWYHVAFVRASGTSKLYVDGTEIISVSDSTNYTDTYFTVGGWYSSSFLLNGYLQDLRITKGIARYTANFTAPTAAFPTL